MSAEFGTVYGVLLATERERAPLADALHRPPYIKPPIAPILYIKPPGTWREHRGTLQHPSSASHIEVSATVGLIFGERTEKVDPQQALSQISSCLVAIDASLPVEDYYRPSVRQRCYDGSLVLSAPIPAGSIDFDALTIQTFVNGHEADSFETSNLVRPAAKLISDVSRFMRFDEGDVLLLGLTPRKPQVRAGDVVSACVSSLGELEARVRGSS